MRKSKVKGADVYGFLCSKDDLRELSEGLKLLPASRSRDRLLLRVLEQLVLGKPLHGNSLLSQRDGFSMGATTAESLR